MHCTLPEGHGLLAPITLASPAGSNLRSSDLFLQTRDTRNAARDSERQRAQGLFSDNSRLLAQWQQVNELCRDILVTHSKDLDVCAWLIEAQSRLHGAQGLADALTLYCELIQRYWDEVFPRPDATESAEACVAALSGLNGNRRPGSVVEAINNFRITCGDESSHGDFYLWHYRAALEIRHMADDARRQQRTELLGYSLQDIQQAANRTAADFYCAEFASIESAQMALHRLDAVLTQKLGPLAPATTMMRDALGNLHDAIFHLAGNRLQAEDGINREEPDIDPPAAERVASTVEHTPAIQRETPSDRDQAIQALITIADYFRRAEPHSPLAYSLDTLIRRARMPFDQLMCELIPDPTSRDVFQRMTGVPLIEASDLQTTT